MTIEAFPNDDNTTCHAAASFAVSAIRLADKIVEDHEDLSNRLKTAAVQLALHAGEAILPGQDAEQEAACVRQVQRTALGCAILLDVLARLEVRWAPVEPSRRLLDHVMCGLRAATNGPIRAACWAGSTSTRGPSPGRGTPSAGRNEEQ